MEICNQTACKYYRENEENKCYVYMDIYFCPGARESKKTDLDILL